MDASKKAELDYKQLRLDRKQVRSDNDASEVGILGHFGTFWDNLEDFLTI